jgi:hypothetical protein
MIPGALDGMTRAEAWRNEYAIRRLAAIEREHHEETGRENEPKDGSGAGARSTQTNDNPPGDIHH